MMGQVNGGLAMNVTLSPKHEAMVRRKVEAGLFEDPSDVVEEALRLMEARDRYERLKAAVAIGDEQYARGEVTTWTSNSLEELKREADEEDRQGLPISDDALPPA
jgi:antitoxin ParD1/3/4